MVNKPQTAFSGDDLKEWVSLGQTAIENYDPGLWDSIRRINEVPDAPISSEEFNAKFIIFQQVFCELCDAEEESMTKSSMPREKLKRHAENHLGILDKIHHVHFHSMVDGTLTAQQIYEQLVSEIFQHLVDFHINYDY